MYEIIYDTSIRHDFHRMHPEDVRRVKRHIHSLRQDPHAGKRLMGIEIWSLRVGKYRVLYKVLYESKRVFILQVSHRKNAYD